MKALKIAKIVRTVTPLARFSFKGNETIVYHVKNETGTVYMCTLNSNGTSGCYDMEGNECNGHKYGRTCYHVKEARRIESERTARLTPAPAKRPISEAPLHHNEGFSIMRETRRGQSN